MSNIKYVKGNLFDLAPKGAYLAHACNCQGVWGSGIAVEFRKRFPKAYKQYVNICKEWSPEHNIGDYLILSDEVVVLFTSKDYGQNKCHKDEILYNTESSLSNIVENETSKITLHIPKINSGLFGVPWEETEAILKKFDGKLNFVVYELE